jgi:pseudouridine kinase
VVIGGANIDIKGKTFGKLISRTSNPGELNMTLGGVGRNIAHNLALLGVPVTFLSVVGDDEWGRKILKETGGAGVDVGQVKQSRKNSTGTYLAILDDKGEMEVAVSDMRVCEEANVRYIKSKEEIIKGSKIVVIDTNIPEKSIKYIGELCSREDIILVAEPVSVEKAKKLKKVLDKINYITPNKEELESIIGGGRDSSSSDKVKIKIDSDEDIKKTVQKLRGKYKDDDKGEGIKNIVLTLAERGVYLSSRKMGKIDKNREVSGGKGEDECGYECSKFIKPYKVEVIDVTGVGDALVAGLVYGIYKGYSFEEAAKYGLAAAALTISTPYTVSTGMGEDILQTIVEE